jgi:hypothetical protein
VTPDYSIEWLTCAIASRDATVALADRDWAGDWFYNSSSRDLGIRWLLVPAGGDLDRGPLVPALRAVLERRAS